ncbi:hypothetical protein [Paenibacillus taichungensis]
MMRRIKIQEKFHERNSTILKSAQSNKGTRLSIIEESHSIRRENFRMYSRTELKQAFLKGKLISSSFNSSYGEYRFVIKHSFSSSYDYERPIHLVISAHKSNLFDWTIITVLDPAARKWKWDEKYEVQKCFCDRNLKLNNEYN